MDPQIERHDTTMTQIDQITAAAEKTTAIAQSQAPSWTQEVYALIDERRQTWADALAERVSLDQWVLDAKMVVAGLAADEPAIRTVMSALRACAQLGLRPGVMGHAWIISRRHDGRYVADLQVGYQGYLHLIRRSGDVVGVVARPVYQGDHFEVRYEEQADILTHIPDLDTDTDAETPVRYYAVIRYRHGCPIIATMSHREVMTHRDKTVSPATLRHPQSPWNRWRTEMALKTVLLKAIKYAPMMEHIVGGIEQAEQDVATEITE